MRYTSLIWDFDGTLFNTYPRIASAFRQALSNLNIDASAGEIMPRIKQSVRGAVREYAAAYRLDAGALFAQYQQCEHALPSCDMQPYEGICELLRDAANSGCRHFLYTHRDHSALEALEVHGLAPLFSGFITSADDFPPKPAPDALSNLIKRHQLAPQSSLMLGDRDIDVLAARNASIDGLLFDPEHFYDGFANDLRADSVAGIRALIGL